MFELFNFLNNLSTLHAIVLLIFEMKRVFDVSIVFKESYVIYYVR